MTDAEINRRLALAIGWDEKQIEASAVCDSVILPSPDHGENYRVFDYRDPAVIWPIAERFDCFPSKTHWDDPARSWSVFFDDSCESGRTEYVEAENAAKAVALAIIKAREGAKE